MLVVPNPAAAKAGVAGYEIALDFNATPFQLMPLTASEIKGPEKFQLRSVNESVERAQSLRPFGGRARRPLGTDRQRIARTGIADVLNHRGRRH